MGRRVSLLGIPIDAISAAEALERLRTMLAGSEQHHVMTPNSEMIVEAGRNERFRSILQATSLNLPDGAGLLWAARHTGQKIPERVAGVDTIEQLLEELGSEHPVFFLGGRKSVGHRASVKLKEYNARLNVVGTYEGSPRPEDAADIVRRINEAKPHLLLVAYGAPKQDLWIAEHLQEMPSVRVAMGVGGTFDFIAGTAKRAPQWMQGLGLEWLWRLIREPWRVKRIWNAVIVFPLLVLRSRR